jgi:hypothetical protein
LVNTVNRNNMEQAGIRAATSRQISEAGIRAAKNEITLARRLGSWNKSSNKSPEERSS